MKIVDIKKVWNCSLCLIILGAICIFTPVRAQSTAQIFILPEEITVPVGNEMMLELVVTGGDQINAFDVTIYYDSPVLSLMKWEHGDLLSNLAVMLVINEPGILRVAATQLATPAVSGGGVLLELYFRAESAGTTLVDIDAAEFANSQGVKSLPTRNDGVVSVSNLPTYTPTATIVPTRTVTRTAVPTLTQPALPTATMALPSPTVTLLPSATATPGVDIEATEMAEAFQLGQLTATVTATAPKFEEAATKAQAGGSVTEEILQPTQGDEVAAVVEGNEPAQVVTVDDDESGADREPAQSGVWESVLWGLLLAGGIAILILFVLIIKRKRQESEGYLL
jgi:hypothetical protein